MGWAKWWHRSTEDILGTKKERLGNAFSAAASQKWCFPPLGPSDIVLCTCRVWWPPSSQDHILRQLHFFPLAPVPLPHTQVFYQCLPNKGGKLWFHFALVQHHSNFYLKTAEPFQCNLVSEKSTGLPLTGTTIFLWVPWWETCIFFTLSYSWSLFSRHCRCLPPVLTHSAIPVLERLDHGFSS